MAHRALTFNNVSFSYPSSRTPLFSELTFTFDDGWTGVVGINGAGKTTLLLLALGELTHDIGAITRPDTREYCEQRTDEPSDRIRQFDSATDGERYRLADVLRIGDDWLDRWETLSHGERKRMQIASCLWADPELLAVDEPTNHLDRESRRYVADALRRYRGIGLIVSHDRELLDSLCTHTVFVEPPCIEKRKGSYTIAAEERDAELRHTREQYLETRDNLRRLEREASKRRALAASQQARRSKKGLALKDHDARYRKNVARISGKDGVGGKLLGQMSGRLEQERQKLDSLITNPVHETGISIDAAVSKRDALFRSEACVITFGEGPTGVTLPDLEIAPDSRIAVTGPNGSGKSTLLESIVASLELPRERFIYIPQELTASESAEITDEIGSLNNDELGELMAVVSRLGSRPERLLATTLPSPGETRKFMLALGILREPWLIAMDEPTNHMDLQSVEAIEAALAGTPCALLLVSHDERFLAPLSTIRWEMTPSETGFELTIQPFA